MSTTIGFGIPTGFPQKKTVLFAGKTTPTSQHQSPTADKAPRRGHWLWRIADANSRADVSGFKGIL